MTKIIPIFLLILGLNFITIWSVITGYKSLNMLVDEIMKLKGIK